MSSGRTRGGAGARRMDDPWATSSTAASRPAYGTSDVDLYQTADRNYLRTIDDLRAKVKSLRTTAKKLSSLRSSFQSGTATARQRELLQTSVHRGKNEASAIQAALDQYDRNFLVDHLTASERNERESEKRTIATQFQAVLEDFSTSINACRLQATTRRRTSTASSDDDRRALRDDKSANIEAQIQAVEFDEALIDEEEEDIERLVADIADVNMLTKRVATLVHEQGEQLGHVELNVTSAHDQAQAGVKHLEKAEKSQRSARTKLICLLVIILVIAGALTGIIVATQKKK